MKRADGTAGAGPLKDRAKEIRRIARRHGVVRVRVFGSHATGAATGTSDLDLLVDLRPRRDLLDLIGFKLDLEDLLGCEVDVLTEGGLSPYLRARILRQAKSF
jgi:predicted nucleotidyltransferase